MLSSLDVILNATSPVLNLGLFSWPGNLCSGIANVPEIAPLESVTSGLPAIGLSTSENAEDVGVQN